MHRKSPSLQVVHHKSPCNISILIFEDNIVTELELGSKWSGYSARDGGGYKWLYDLTVNLSEDQSWLQEHFHTYYQNTITAPHHTSYFYRIFYIFCISFTQVKKVRGMSLFSHDLIYLILFTCSAFSNLI